jgi:hypothetical protein
VSEVDKINLDIVHRMVDLIREMASSKGLLSGIDDYVEARAIAKELNLDLLRDIIIEEDEARLSELKGFRDYTGE